MIVAFARLSLRISHSHSLKEKRRTVRSLVDKVKSRFDVRLSEVGGFDTWQSVELGFAVVGSDRVVLDQIVDRVIRYVDGFGDAELVADFRDSLYYGDELAFATAEEASE